MAAKLAPSSGEVIGQAHRSARPDHPAHADPSSPARRMRRTLTRDAVNRVKFAHVGRVKYAALDAGLDAPLTFAEVLAHVGAAHGVCERHIELVFIDLEGDETPIECLEDFQDALDVMGDVPRLKVFVDLKFNPVVAECRAAAGTPEPERGAAGDTARAEAAKGPKVDACTQHGFAAWKAACSEDHATARDTHAASCPPHLPAQPSPTSPPRSAAAGGATSMRSGSDKTDDKQYNNDERVRFGSSHDGLFFSEVLCRFPEYCRYLKDTATAYQCEQARVAKAADDINLSTMVTVQTASGGSVAASCATNSAAAQHDAKTKFVTLAKVYAVHAATRRGGHHPVAGSAATGNAAAAPPAPKLKATGGSDERCRVQDGAAARSRLPPSISHPQFWRFVKYVDGRL